METARRVNRKRHGFANAWIQDPEMFPESPEDLALRSALLLTSSSKLLLCPDLEEQSVIWWVLYSTEVGKSPDQGGQQREGNLSGCPASSSTVVGASWEDLPLS